MATACGLMMLTLQSAYDVNGHDIHVIMYSEVAIGAVMVLLILGFLVAGFMALSYVKKLTSMLEDLQGKAMPLITKGTALVDDLSPKIRSITTNVEEISFTARAKADELSQTITQMAHATRLDCVLGSASGMRQGVAQAIHHTRHRVAFGRFLADQPLMANVLADLALESQAATAMGMRLAHAVDSGEDALRRLGTAVAKYAVCKNAPRHAAEALECLGGNGYVEESGLPRLYREAPLNGIWEGSGNVNALDVLRAMTREPESVEAFRNEVGLAAGADRRLDEAGAALAKSLTGATEANARRLVEQMAQLLAGSLLIRYAPHAIADAYCASRLAGDWGATFGTLPSGTDTAGIVDWAAPNL